MPWVFGLEEICLFLVPREGKTTTPMPRISENIFWVVGTCLEALKKIFGGFRWAIGRLIILIYINHIGIGPKMGPNSGIGYRQTVILVVFCPLLPS